MKKLLLLAMLVVTIALVSPSGAAWSSDVTPSSVIYFDLAVDDSRRLVYGSDRTGGSVHALSMDTLEVVSTLSVGSEPAGVDISPDDSELAVALFGQGEIAFVDLDVFSVISRTVPAGTSGPNRPYDLLYGRPGRLYSVGNPGSGGFDYVHVFDTDTKQEVGRSTEIMRAAPRLAMTADQNTLYVSQVTFSPKKIYRFDISSDTPSQTAAAPHGPVSVDTLCVVSDRVFTSYGQVWSADLATQLGTFGPIGTRIECSESYQKVYVSSGSRVVGLDAAGLARVFDVNLGHTTGVARLNAAETRLYVSTSDGVRVVPADLEPRAFLPLVANDLCTDFFDDFSSPASGWSVDDNSRVRTEYLNGEYRVLTKQEGYFYLFRSPACERENYSVQVDARWEGKQGSSYGLIFGVQGSFDHYYLFDVNTDYQAFRLYRRSPSGFSQIAAPAVSGAIHAGKATNRLGVTRDGSKIVLYANGTALGTWWDSNISGRSAVGLVTSPYDDRPTSDARFDNFSVAGLETGGAGSTAAEMPGPRATENQVELVPAGLGW